MMSKVVIRLDQRRKAQKDQDRTQDNPKQLLVQKKEAGKKDLVDNNLISKNREVGKKAEKKMTVILFRKILKNLKITLRKRESKMRKLKCGISQDGIFLDTTDLKQLCVLIQID